MLLRLVATVIILIAITACSHTGDGRADPGSTADCQMQIRSGGVEFTQYGATTADGSRFGTARTSTCEDVGEDAAGSVFTADSTQVPTFRFEGYSPSQVLGVKSPQVAGFQVYIADSVESRERDRIYNDLNAHGSGDR